MPYYNQMNQTAWNPGYMWGGYPTVVPNPQNVPIPAQQPVQPEQGLPTINRVVWVQGREAAKSIQLSPSENVMALDSENDRFYLLKAGQDGKPMPIQEFTFTLYKPEEDSANANYVTRKEFDELKASLDALRSPVDAEAKDGE